DASRARCQVVRAIAVADRQRGATAGADDEVGGVAEQEGDGEGAGEPGKHRRDRVLRRCSALDLARDEMPDDLGVRLALERTPLGDQLVAERLEILDDA